jgi:tetratricopeptide (TPR) repeat protein
LTRSRARRTAAVALVAALALGGCATPQTDALRAPAGSPAAAPVQGLPRQARLPDVPFHPQEDYQCGPAALAMALGAVGRARTPESLTAEVYLPARQGTLQAEMLALPRREGLLSIPMPATIAALLRAVADGYAVVVFQNLGLSIMPVWHYAVIVGYDLDADRIYLHSGPEKAMPMGIETFERTWGRGGYWAMVVTTPQRIPAAATQRDALRAAVSLERVDRAAALAAYRALHARAPDDRLTAFALGNAQLADGQAQQAVQTYRALLDHHPDFADGWNNLAEALARAGDLPGAREAAARAIAIGGPGLDTYRETAARLR